MICNDVMTVYNHYTVDGADKWNRSVVSSVMWRHNKTEVITQGTEQTISKAESITIDFRHGDQGYVDPIEFAKLEDKTGHFTLSAKGLDVVVLGVSDKEISKAYKLSALKDDFQYVGTISAVSDNRNVNFLPNIKVVAK
jgi:hypothetical protein